MKKHHWKRFWFRYFALRRYTGASWWRLLAWNVWHHRICTRVEMLLESGMGEKCSNLKTEAIPHSPFAVKGEHDTLN